MTDIKKGDRVKVTFEGVVRGVNARYVSLENDATAWLGELRHDLVTVEKIEPPVEVFKTGDLVRSIDSRNYYLITDKGYLEMNKGIRGQHNPLGSIVFTSKNYERVSFDSLP